MIHKENSLLALPCDPPRVFLRLDLFVFPPLNDRFEHLEMRLRHTDRLPKLPLVHLLLAEFLFHRPGLHARPPPRP